MKRRSVDLSAPHERPTNDANGVCFVCDTGVEDRTSSLVSVCAVSRGGPSVPGTQTYRRDLKSIVPHMNGMQFGRWTLCRLENPRMADRTL